MKSKNILNYSQPDFYKFSRDSIELAQIAAELESENKELNVLEVFSGCGVVSLEFLSRHNSISNLCFIEEQKDFSSHFLSNISDLKIPYEIHWGSFKEVEMTKKFDVILLNPPYFDPASSRLGENQKRNHCRFALNFTLIELFSFLEQRLLENGRAYICHCDDLCKLDKRIERIGSFQEVGLFRFQLNVD